MDCPRCRYTDFTANRTCPRCGFEGEAGLLQELARLDWLLSEMDTWAAQGILPELPENLKRHYLSRRQETLAALGLTYPPLPAEEAEDAWAELYLHEILFEQIEEWKKAGLLKSGLLPTYYARMLELQARLEEHPRPQIENTPETRLAEINFLREAIRELDQRDDFVSRVTKQKALLPLLTEKDRLEAALQPAVKEEAAESPKAEETPAPPRPAPEPLPLPIAPKPPATPLRERLWRTLLSERTLQALLFLGIFLLFVAAVSFVIWGWKDFSAPVRVAIPMGFTALFFGLGWFVRTRTHLYRSAIALSAIAALLVPIDCYTIYANYGNPPQGWEQFWAITSFASLIVYILAALQIQSRFFGYISGAAAGSLLLSLLELLTDISRDWYSAALSLLAVTLFLLGTRLARHPRPGRWVVFSEPFLQLALWIPGILMPLTLGLRFVTRDTYDALHYAMSATWFVGAFLFGWGAVHHRSRSLGILAAIALPVSVYMAQGAWFDHSGINPAWHAFGLALLTPLYLFTGWKLSTYKDDPVIAAHGMTATRWGMTLIVAAALLSLTDLRNGTAAAVSHTVLTASVAFAALLWKKPRTLYAASFFSFTAATFAMTELNLGLNQLGVGWASLAILHILLVLRFARIPPPLESSKPFLPPLVVAAYVIAALAILPPILFYNGATLAYALGNWIALSAWGAYLSHHAQPGFIPTRPSAKPRLLERLIQNGSLYHWFASLPLPLWVWIVNRNNEWRAEVLPILLTALAWFMVLLSHRLGKARAAYPLPWRLTGLTVSIAAPIVAYANVQAGYVPSATLLAVGILYFVNAVLSRGEIGFYPAGLVTAAGLWQVLGEAGAETEVRAFALCVLTAVYFLAGLEAERRKLPGASYAFLAPLYNTAHFLAFVLVARIYLLPLEEFIGASEWTKAEQLWSAGGQLLFGVTYGLFAWRRYQEFWGHIAAWLGMLGGGFVAAAYSQGHGSLAAKGAIIASLMVLAERGLHHLKGRESLKEHLRAFFRLAWDLYQRPLLLAGWTASVAVTLLALVRNLILLGGGRIQQTWAAAGLLIITALYAVSARLFQRARFVWFAVIVVFAPWTILTNLGWFTSFKPDLPDFGVSWVVLAWLFFLISLLVAAHAPLAYARPLKAGTHLLLPFSMLWSVANTEASLFTVGLSTALYAVSAWLRHRQSKQTELPPLAATKFLYPALGLFPLWSVYWLHHLRPGARHEYYGLLLLTFGVLGLLAGLGLERLAPRPNLKRPYRLPAYLTAYISLIVGTMLVAHLRAPLAWALLYDSLLMAVSAWLFHSSLWLYPATALPILSLFIALNEAKIPAERQGWWLMGLAAVYLLGAWLLRRFKLTSYGSPLIAMGFAVTALALPPSSLDRTGAMWGYGAAALLYAVCAFWLGQPLLLTPASALIVVPYAALIQEWDIPLRYQGLSLLPGAALALLAGVLLDRRFGTANLQGRGVARLVNRFLSDWSFPLYALGLGLATAAPFFTDSRADFAALNFLLLAAFYGWAVYRFRSRFWLTASLLALHLSLGYYLEHLDLWRFAHEDEAWLRFLPLTAALTASGLFIERRLNEGSPLRAKMFAGWSRPFYLFVFFDVFFSQLGGLNGSWNSVWLSLGNTLIAAVLASAWRSAGLAYVGALLGFVTLAQWRGAVEASDISLPVHWAALALGYGALGFGYSLLKRWSGLGGERSEVSSEAKWYEVWEVPLQRSGVVLSFLALGMGALFGIDIAAWSVMALFGVPFRRMVDAETVYMAVWVLSLIGLLYVAAAAVYRRVRLGYLAVGMLLAGWFLYAFYVNAWENLRQVQWYAMPAGLYLLGIGFVEWERGNKNLARWLDYAAILLLLGSLFWQTLVFGWQFALLLGAEGLVTFWWGSARRLRRFFYAGMAGVVLAVLGQLLNALQEVNQWITFGLIGLLLVILAVIVERRLEAIKAWQQVLESWE
ncbi:MAG: SCO7613 C-terminal domain-containing membrane protein [Chloroflexota bacterium]